MTCLQTVMCNSIKHGYRICQLDFVAVYLNGELRDMDIFMVLPPGRVKGLGLISGNDVGVVLHTDNQAAQWVASSNGPQQNKALTLWAAYIKDTVKRGLVIIKWIPGKLQVADGLTKLLNARGSNKSQEDLGVLAE
ncbi:hypothetical protein NDA14_002758 [Ustilago hordei]|nr:hypothetical protein NDA14_002758 [Ustilago hordei]